MKMARRSVLQVVCLLLMVSPCGCDDILGILAGGKRVADPLQPGVKDTSPAVPLQHGDPALEPPLPTQISAPAAKDGDRGIPPVRPQISKVGTYQQDQQGIADLSLDSQAYLSPNSIHNSDESQVGTGMPSKGLLSKSVKNLDLGNRQKPDKERETTPFLNNLGAANTLSSAQRTNTDAVADTTTKSSAVKEAKKTQEIINKEQFKLHEDGNKADDSQTNHADRLDMGVLSSSADQFPESQVNKEALQNQNSGGQALNRNSEDNIRNQNAGDDAGMLDSFVGPVSQSPSTAETEHKTEIQSHSTAVYSSGRDHADLGSSNISPNMALPGIPDNRPSLPEDIRPNVSHNVSNNTDSPSAERPAVPAENVSLEKGISGVAGSTIAGTPQQSSSDHPDLASKEEEGDLLHGTYDDDGGDVDEDDRWYFNPDNTNKKEDKVEFSSASLWFLFSTPQPAQDEAKDVDDKKESPYLPDIPEKVMKVEDMEKKKKISGPKDGIILYTVLIVILITGIVSFSLWKNASKKSRPRNSMSMMPTGEEGKRLLDHPFV